MFLFILALFSLWGMKSSIIQEEIAFDIDGALKKETAEQGYFDKKILLAIQNEKFDDVEMYADLAKFLHIKLEPRTQKEIDKNNTFEKVASRNLKEFTTGFINGKGDSSVGMAGSIASDMTVVGDIRDLSREGMKFSNNEKYDKVVLGVATIGIGLTASQLFSAGASTPLKVGASIVKVAKKSQKLSEGFLAVISSKLSKAVDMKMLKQIDFSSVSNIKKIQPIINKSIKLEPISKLFSKINRVKKNTSTYDTISILKYVNNEKDLAKVVKLSSKYKKNTKGVLAILGKGAFKGATTITKYTAMFMTQLVMAILSFLGFIAGVFSNIKLFILGIKKVKSFSK